MALFLLPPIFSRFKCSFSSSTFECLPIAVFSALFHSSLAVRKPGKKKRLGEESHIRIQNPKIQIYWDSVFRTGSPSLNYSSPRTSATSCNSTSRSHPLRGFVEDSSLAHRPVEWDYSDERTRIVFLQLFAIF